MAYNKSGYRSGFLSSQGTSLYLEKARCKQILEHIRQLEKSGQPVKELGLQLGIHIRNLFSVKPPEYDQRIKVNTSRQKLVKNLMLFAQESSCDTKLMEFYHYIKDVK